MTRKTTYVIGALLCLLVSVNGFSQGTVNATVGGTVADASGALIPGVTVTATNVGTNIANSVVTNESGAYNFASLQPGVYRISAELPGFQTQVFTDVQLGGAQQVRLNFNLQVAAAVGTNVEVTVAADTLLATSSNSIGTVLPDYKIRELPTVAANVFNLVQNMPGVQRNAGGTFGFMAGGRLGDVNATRDGVNVNDGRYENGAWSVVYTPPEMVEEVKVIVAPIDAETSRGNGQVQLVSRSGTNQFRGTVSYSNHNSALDANSWFNNFNGVGKAYDNRNQYVASVGGPVIKNKTFFFALFTGQRDVKKNQATGTTLTNYAKAGIFRYWPGADPANANNNNPSVDRAGNPIRPANATGDLAAIGLFGSCNFNGAPVPNCRTFSDPLRSSISSHPFLQEQMKRMPSPNEFTGGDGLNTATIRFTRRQDGLDLTNGNGDEVNRDSYNLKIDHNFNSKHKATLIATKEKTWGTATQAGLRNWPLSYDGLAVKRPYLYSLQVTSTLSGSLLNQVRVAKRASNNWQWGSADRGDAIGAEARKLHATANGIPYQVTFATTGITSFSNIGGFGRWREGINPMRSIGDDLSWNVGSHSFKTGFEYRIQESNGFNDPNYTPLVTLGAGNNAISGLDAAGGFAGLTTNAATTARNLIYDLAGSVTSLNQAFGILSAQDTVLRGTPEIRNNAHWNKQSEISSYFKDNWKFSNDLTLNLGIHWEYYGQPYEHNGLAARVVGDESALTNVQCTGSPGTIGFTSTCTNLVQVQLVGKNSTHPEIGTNVRGNDLNNFGPSFGLAWTMPWFGKGKTTIRSGYGMNYSGAARNFITVDGVIGTVPGINQVFGGGGLAYNPATFTSLNTVSLPIPFPTGTATSAPFTVQPTQRSLGLTTYSNVAPYTQNWNLEIQRELAKNTILEVRYIGTKGTKLGSNVDLNAISYWKPNPQLFEAFNAVRGGGESALLNQMFMGIGLAGTPVVNGTTVTAASILRQNTTTRAFFANGNFGGFLNALNGTLNYTGNPSSDRGSILRRAGFPENYLVPSPQYSAVNIAGNNQNSGYHSLNVQISRRLTSGFANTTTWVWSKAFETGDTVDPNRRGANKTLQAVDRKFQITSNGTYELPFGTGHSLLGNAPGWVQHIVGKWQLGGILNFNTGSPISITSGISTIGTNGARPNVVGAIPSDMGKLKKCSTANPCYTNTSTPVTSGVIFFDGFTQPTDPGLASVWSACATATGACSNLLGGYSNRAIADPQGNIILVNPQPGQEGTLGENTLRGPSALFFDMNLLKRFRITESKTFEFSLNAINILNHPNFANPSSALNTNNTFGRITALASGADLGGNGGMRSFIVNTRLNF
jgi:hypothetical protein